MLALLLALAARAEGLKCWGGNAIALQLESGESKCCSAGRDKGGWDLFRYHHGDVCYDKCAGLTWFEGHSSGNRPFANPDGKQLCPGVVDKGE